MFFSYIYIIDFFQINFLFAVFESLIHGTTAVENSSFFRYTESKISLQLTKLYRTENLQTYTFDDA